MTSPAINLARIAAAGALWAAQAAVVAADATSALRLASRLPEPSPGAYGRDFAGRNAGAFARAAADPYRGQTTLAGLIAAGVAQRALVAAAGVALNGVTDIATGFGAAAQAVVTALAGCAVDPADGVRLMAQFSAFLPEGPDAASAAGQRVGDLFRRLAGQALAAAAAQYQPASADDATRLRAQVVDLIDAAVLAAADQGEDLSFMALRRLRAAVVADLNARGAALPGSTLVALPSAMPALALSQRLFGDAAEADDLVLQADPVSPLFMPLSFSVAAPR